MSKLTENKLEELLNAGTTEEEILNTFRTLKRKAEKKAERESAIANKRKEVINKVIDYVTFVTEQKPTTEEENTLKKYIEEVLRCAEDVVDGKKEPEVKVTKRGWRDGKKMTEAEIDEVFNKFWKGFV